MSFKLKNIKQFLITNCSSAFHFGDLINVVLLSVFYFINQTHHSNIRPSRIRQKTLNTRSQLGSLAMEDQLPLYIKNKNKLIFLIQIRIFWLYALYKKNVQNCFTRYFLLNIHVESIIFKLISYFSLVLIASSPNFCFLVT